jgi:hypothetical protein
MSQFVVMSENLWSELKNTCWGTVTQVVERYVGELSALHNRMMHGKAIVQDILCLKQLSTRLTWFVCRNNTTVLTALAVLRKKALSELDKVSQTLTIGVEEIDMRRGAPS